MQNSETSLSIKEIIPGVVVIDVITLLIAVAVSWFSNVWLLDAFADVFDKAGFVLMVVGALVGVVVALISRGQRHAQFHYRGNQIAMTCIGAGMTLLAVSFLLLNSVD